MLRGYIEFIYPVKPSRQFLPGAQYIYRSGTREETRSSYYDDKDTHTIEGPWEHGCWELNPGSRNAASKLTGNKVISSSTPFLLHQETDTSHDNVQLYVNAIVQALEKIQLECAPKTTIIHNITNNNIVTSHVTNNTINNSITINNLGHEDLSDFPDERLKELVMQQRAGFLTFVKETRLNPNKPENRNIRIVSKKKNIAVIKQDGEWKQASIAQSIEAALDKSKSQFFKPLANEEYVSYLIDKSLSTVDWCQKMMSKSRSEWWPIKSTFRSELESCYTRSGQ